MSEYPASDLTRVTAYTSVRNDVIKLVPEASIRILDFGCSNGALGRELMLLNRERLFSGIELDPELAAEARLYLNEVYLGDLEKDDWIAKFSNNTFDCLIFADVLEHLPYPAKLFEKADRLLVPGGTVIISVPNVRHISAFMSVFVSGTFPRRSRGIFDATHLRWFTIGDARRFVEKHGFIIESIEPTLRWGDRGGGIVNKALNKLPNVIKTFGPIREFLTYQYCFRAKKPY